MTTSTGFTASWHLERSRPADILAYADPFFPFIGQINKLVARFQGVQFLCTHGTPPEELTALRNTLAFHIVKMSRWWNFDFCPRGVLELSGPVFMDYVKAHLEQSCDDETLYDVFTLQRYMRAGDVDHIVILGRDEAPGQDSTLYGVDGQRRFRFASGTEKRGFAWRGTQYPDFPAMWLAARHEKADRENDAGSACDMRLAQAEHRLASIWHQRYFHATCERNTVQRYAEACMQLSHFHSAFGRIEGESIINSLAFRIVRLAVHARRSVADLLTGNPETRMDDFSASTVEQRARTHVFTCADETRQAALTAIVDCVGNYRPRRCC
ncbi:hypothetical protein GOB93_10965 [Acetobacter musti]|uniref:Uncharacterized protein n=1 Tax=Acetobacter musti TaxID=864732 RepID=A0ABX0JSZ2_9PROT|nr:hypothetical protein [Acetobacter musti]NHN85158.1 hypothetical protein [Acetobacter musti]